MADLPKPVLIEGTYYVPLAANAPDVLPPDMIPLLAEEDVD